jgi:hypothetical protein
MDCFSGKEILYENYLDPDDAELYRYIELRSCAKHIDLRSCSENSNEPSTVLLGAGSN